MTKEGMVQRRCQHGDCRAVFEEAEDGSMYCSEHRGEAGTHLLAFIAPIKHRGGGACPHNKPCRTCPYDDTEAWCSELNKAPITCAESCIELVVAVLGGDPRTGKQHSLGRGEILGREWLDLAAGILKSPTVTIRNTYSGIRVRARRRASTLSRRDRHGRS